MGIFDGIRSIVRYEPVVPAPLAHASAPTTLDAVGPVEAFALAAQAMPPIGQTKPTWPKWDPERAANIGYNRLALVYRCANIIAHALGTAKVRVVDEAKDGEHVDDHPMRVLMKRPNPLMDEAAFWSAIGIRTAMAGFCVVEKERDRLGNVIGLWPLQSAWLKAKKRRDGRHDWEYRVPRIPAPFELRAEDVLVFTWADTPDGSAYGMGPLEACLREIAISNEMRDFLKRMMETGAVPMYGLVPDPEAKKLTQTEIEALLDAFVARRGGLANATRPAYMQAIKEIVRLGFDMNELAYVDLHDLSELAIVQAFGIPASVAQIRVGLQHSDSRANAEVDEAKLYRQTIIPLWTRFDGVLSLDLLAEFPGSERLALEFDTSDIEALQDDRNAKAPWVIQAFGAGILSQHMALRELGIPVPKTDDYYSRSFAVEVVPVDQPIPEPEPAQTPPPAQEPPPQLKALSATTRGRGYAGRYAKAVNSRKLIRKVANTREPSIRAFFRAQGQRLVPKLRQGLATTGPSERYDAAIDWAAEEAELDRILTKLYQLAGDTAYGAINEQLGVDLDFDLANPNLDQARELLAQRVTEVTDETRSVIQDVITRAGQEGKTTDEIAAELEQTFNGWTGSRAQTIARTESMASFGYASAAGYRESGVVDRIQCFDNPDHNDDYGAEDGLSCADRNGLIAPLEDAELHVRSEHPNGSLSIAPVLTGEE